MKLPGPIGRLKIIQIAICSVQTIKKAIEYGSIEEINVPTEAFLLYFCINTSNMGNQFISGVIILVHESPIRYASCVNSGLYPIVINIGTKIGAIIAHFAEADPKNKSMTHTSKTKPTASGIPVICAD
mgnify:CR=1 FL=1